MHGLGHIGQAVVEVLDACKHVGVIWHLFLDGYWGNNAKLD